MNLLLVDDEAFALEALEHAIDWKSLGIDQVFPAAISAEPSRSVKNPASRS